MYEVGEVAGARAVRFFPRRHRLARFRQCVHGAHRVQVFPRLLLQAIGEESDLHRARQMLAVGVELPDPLDHAAPVGLYRLIWLLLDGFSRRRGLCLPGFASGEYSRISFLQFCLFEDISLCF